MALGRVVAFGLLALALAGCGATKRIVVHAATSPGLQMAPQVQELYGHIVSLKPASGGFLMRFDPAFWLTGITANAAAAQAEGIACAPTKCEPVPNDHYVVDDGHQTLVFVVPAATSGTVLTSDAHLSGTRITAARLAAIIAQGNNAKLLEPLESGVWIRVRIDRVVAFAQQYVP